MAIELPDETRRRLIGSLKRFAAEHLEEEIGDLKAALLCDYLLAEFGPVVYNRAIADAQAHLHERVTELDASCYEPEFTYWRR
jgi:uncharacterized protein (DUF2164 family)